MNPSKVTTNNIPKKYQSAELNRYVQALSTPQPSTVSAPKANLPTEPLAASTIITPPQPVNLPNINTNNLTQTSNQIATDTQSKVDADILNDQKQAEAIQKASGGDATQSAVMRLVQGAKNLYTQRSEASKNQAVLEEQAGLSKEIIARNEINTQIANTQLELRREQDRIRATPMSEGQARVQEGAIADTYGRRLADLAIRQAAATGNIEAIKSEAERKTKLITDAIDNEINFFKEFESMNIDLLDKKQKEKLALIVSNKEQRKADETKLEQAKAEMLTEISQNGGGTNTALVRRIQEAQSIGDVYGIASGSGFIGKLDRQLKQAQLVTEGLQQAKLRSEATALSAEGTGNPDALQAYANEYAQTGKIPSPNDLAKSGLSVAQVTQYARQLPKQNGQIVATQTNATPNNISADKLDGLLALKDIVEKTKQLKELDTKRVQGIPSALLGKTFGTKAQSDYIALRDEIIDQLARARSGAALTEDEVKLYKSQLPGRVGETVFGIGKNTQNSINNFESKIDNTLKTKLQGYGTSMYGYSKVKIGNQDYTVGETVKIGGQPFKVLPDGSLTDII